MSSSLKAIILAASVVITIGILGIALFISRVSTEQAASGFYETNVVINDVEDYNLSAMNGKIVQGSQLVSLLNEEDTNKITIKTKANQKGFLANDSSVMDELSDNYVNPLGMFSCRVADDGYVFTQVESGGSGQLVIDQNEEIDEFNRKIADAEAERDSLQEKVKELQATVDDLQERVDAVADYEEQVSEKDRLLEELANKHTELELTKDELAETNKSIKDLESQIENTRNAISSMTSDITNLKNKYNSLQSSINSVNKQISDTKSEIDRIKNSLANSSMKSITGRVDDRMIFHLMNHTYGNYKETYGDYCGKEGSSYYYDFTLNRRIENLDKAVLVLQLVSPVDKYQSSSGWSATIENGTSAPTGRLYNNAIGNTVLRVYSNRDRIESVAMIGTDQYYYASGVQYTINYI